MESYLLNADSQQESHSGHVEVDLPSQPSAVPEAKSNQVYGEERKAELGDHSRKLTSSTEASNPLIRSKVVLLEGATEIEGVITVPKDPLLSGGYADIFQGSWTRQDGSQMEVAVKKFKPIIPRSRTVDSAELQQRKDKRLRRELSVWTRIIHPNIHPLLGIWSNPEPRLISPWCSQGNLADYLHENSTLSQISRLNLVIQAACGLAYLHAQNPPICHGDIKLENVLINDKDCIVLTDFGLSRVMLELDEHTGLTTGPEPHGTRNYMAPELFTDEDSRSTLKTDVYAFGGLILAVQTGKPPFGHVKSPGTVMFMICSGKRPEPKDHPLLKSKDPLWELMNKCWGADPKMRPSMLSVESELRKLKEQSAMQQEKAEQPSLPNPGGASASPAFQYQMVLQNLKMQRKVSYYESAVLGGPPHAAVWTATIYLTEGSDGKVIHSTQARAAKRIVARDEASCQALVWLRDSNNRQ